MINTDWSDWEYEEKPKASARKAPAQIPFGEMLRQLRESKKLSVRGAAKAFDRSPSWWSKVERGSEKPGYEFVLSVALKLDTDERFGEAVLLCAAGHLLRGLEKALLSDPALCLEVWEFVKSKQVANDD